MKRDPYNETEIWKRHQHTATHCNTYISGGSPATHCSTRHCNTLQHINTLLIPVNTLQHTATRRCNADLINTHCNTLQNTNTLLIPINTLQHTATHCNTWIPCCSSSTHCNILQHTATRRCIYLSDPHPHTNIASLCCTCVL